MRAELDQSIRDQFPGARFIEQVESIVLQYQDTAIHVYPAEFTLAAIHRLVQAQNMLAKRVAQQEVELVIGGKHIPVRVNNITSVAILPDGRVYTISPYISAPNLERIGSSTNNLPAWLQMSDLPTLQKSVDQAIVSTVGLRNLPNEYQSCDKNIHVGEDQITIVDITSIVAKFL